MNQVMSAAPVSSAHETGDAELLTRFSMRQEEDAFETLVRRHGPMVLRVCQRLLGAGQAAEDAFQATFIVLMRRAGTLAHKDLLSHWLYKVAYRVALKARAQEARRAERDRELARRASAEVEPDHLSAEAESRDLRPVIDEEIARLPEKYRAPVVLSYLEGKTTDETASLLGWSRGTVATRLSRARDLLRDRLARRGLAYTSAALLGFLTEAGAEAGVPELLVESTCQGVTQLASGQATQVVSSAAQALAHAALTRFSLGRALLLTGSAGLVLLIALSIGGPSPAPSAAAPVEPAATKEAPPEPFLANWNVEQVLHEANGVLELPTQGIEHGKADRIVQALSFSPDQRYLAAGGNDGAVKVWDLASTTLVLRLGVHAAPVTALTFSPSGQFLAGASTDGRICMGDVRNRRIVSFTSETADIVALAFSADSKQLLGGHKDGTLTTWDTTGKLLGSRNIGVRNIQIWACAGDAPRAACSDDRHAITLINHQTGKSIPLGSDWPAQALAFAEIDDIPMLLALDSSGRRVRIWHADTGKLISTGPWQEEVAAGKPAAIRSLVFAADGRALAWARDDGSIALRRAASCAPAQE